MIICGVFLILTKPEDALAKSLEFFEPCIEKDPRFRTACPGNCEIVAVVGRRLCQALKRIRAKCVTPR